MIRCKISPWPLQPPSPPFYTMIFKIQFLRQITNLETSILSKRDVLSNLDELDATLLALRTAIMDIKSQQQSSSSALNDDVSSSADDVTTNTVSTFFSTRTVDFGKVKEEMTTTTDGREKIPLELFISACEDYTQFFERLGTSSLMATIKADINGNIEKIKKNCQRGPYKNIEFLLVSYNSLCFF